MVKTLENKKRVFSLALICMLIILSIPFAFKQLVNINSKVKTQNEQLQALEADLASLDKLLEDKESYSQKIDVILDTLPVSYREVAGYTVELEELTEEKNQILDTSIDRSTVSEESNLASLKYNIKTEGSFANFREFLSGLAYLPYHTKINSIKLEEENGTANTLTVYKVYMLDYKPTSEDIIPSFDTNKIDNLYHILNENRSGGGDNL